jgi:hypothetical protein
LAPAQHARAQAGSTSSSGFLDYCTPCVRSHSQRNGRGISSPVPLLHQHGGTPCPCAITRSYLAMPS